MTTGYFTILWSQTLSNPLINQSRDVSGTTRYIFASERYKKISHKLKVNHVKRKRVPQVGPKECQNELESSMLVDIISQKFFGILVLRKTKSGK